MGTNIDQLYNDIKSIKIYLSKISCCNTFDVIMPTNDMRLILEDLLRLKTHELYNLEHTINVVDDLRSCLNCTESIKNSRGSIRCMRYDMDATAADCCLNHRYMDDLEEEYINIIKE